MDVFIGVLPNRTFPVNWPLIGSNLHLPYVILLLLLYTLKVFIMFIDVMKLDFILVLFCGVYVYTWFMPVTGCRSVSVGQ